MTPYLKSLTQSLQSLGFMHALRKHYNGHLWYGTCDKAPDRRAQPKSRSTVSVAMFHDTASSLVFSC